MTQLHARLVSFPLREAFTIARGSKTEARVVEVSLEEGPHIGRGEAVPYARYGETCDGVLTDVRTMAPWLAARPPDGATRRALLEAMPAGAARNALDLALIDLASKQAGERAWTHLGVPAPAPTRITQTVPIVDPASTQARVAGIRAPVIKLKLGRPDDLARVQAAREGAPASRLIVDANESWDMATLTRMAPPLAHVGVELIEQPLPADDDDALTNYRGPIPLCADESCHGTDLAGLAACYQAINLKLDKAGGLTAALELLEQAESAGLAVMLGCMVASSLAIAPATLLTHRARWVDLDGATFLSDDRPGLRLDARGLHPPEPTLWG
ncbi:MAG: dipeptide epimerase [Sandaracinaceae bacterium]